MQLKLRNILRILSFCMVIMILIRIFSNSYMKELFRVDFKEIWNMTHQKYSQEKARINEIYVSERESYTDNMKKLQPMYLNVTSNCKNVLYPLHLARRQSWQTTDKNNHAYVFSAYLDKMKHKIVIVGLAVRGSSKYQCQFWNKKSKNENVKMEEKYAQVESLTESHGRRYVAVLFHCMFSPSDELLTHVSIVTRSCETPMNVLDIQFLYELNGSKLMFTVCLTPLNFNYNRDYEIIEWIELNRILGADKFIVYNFSSAINIEHVLDYYSKRGLTEVVKWDLPVGVDTWPRENKTVEIHYFGQIAALHDCLYRNKGISEFIVNLDVDEFIIPHGRNVTTWSQMLAQLKSSSKAYLFRNTFFKKEWNNEGIEIQNKTLVEKLRLVTLQKLQHETKISPPYQRSKYFAKADNVTKIMVHGVSNVPNVHVPIEIGIVHHYRNWETLNDPEHVKVLDKTVPQKFGELLIKNVQKVWSDLNL